MVIYEVNLFIKNSIFSAYKSWLEKHIREMLEFSGFHEAKILSENNSKDSSYADTDESKLVIQYTIESQDDLNNYFEHKAPIMRKKGTDLFGDKFRAERRILNVELFIGK